MKLAVGLLELLELLEPAERASKPAGGGLRAGWESLRAGRKARKTLDQRGGLQCQLKVHQTQLEEPQILLSGPQIQLEGPKSKLKSPLGGTGGIDNNEKN